MIFVNWKRLLAVASLLLLTTGVMTSRPRKMQRLTTGTWGGIHIIIDVKERSASISYDCATGAITGPLTLERSGRFTWRGTFQGQHPGPTRMDEVRNESAVVYTGTVIRDEMKLNVKRADSDEVLGDFILKRGAPGRVFRCK